MMMVATVLNPVVHRRLIDDIDHVCLTANVPKHMLHESAKGHLTEEELEWVLNFRAHQEHGRGLVLCGEQADVKMMAITAALLRNFIDARIMTVTNLLENDTSPSVLLVPNFYVKAMNKALPAWQVQKLYDRLLERYSQNRPTVLYVESLAGLEKDYGSVLARHLKDHYAFA
jgi:hypothetical protein